MNKPPYTKRELADMAGVSYSRVHDYLYRLKICEPYKKGNANFYGYDALDAINRAESYRRQGLKPKEIASVFREHKHPTMNI